MDSFENFVLPIKQQEQNGSVNFGFKFSFLTFLRYCFAYKRTFFFFVYLAIFLNPKYTKALARRAKAHDITKEKRSALEGLLKF